MATETATVDVGRALHGLRRLRELTEDAHGA
jgi:hypothetical protein